MLIVIDGYNVILTVPNLEKYVKVNNIEEAREILISILIRYKIMKKYNIVLVFDSSHDRCNKPARQEIQILKLFTRNTVKTLIRK